jgi:hypothetical protein
VLTNILRGVTPHKYTIHVRKDKGKRGRLLFWRYLVRFSTGKLSVLTEISPKSFFSSKSFNNDFNSGTIASDDGMTDEWERI